MRGLDILSQLSSSVTGSSPGRADCSVGQKEEPDAGVRERLSRVVPQHSEQECVVGSDLEPSKRKSPEAATLAALPARNGVPGPEVVVVQPPQLKKADSQIE